MSVPKSKRSNNPNKSLKFLQNLEDLNVILIKAIAEGPKRYLNTYGAMMIQICGNALCCAGRANSIVPEKSSVKDLFMRRDWLVEARAECEAISLQMNVMEKLYAWDTTNKKQHLVDLIDAEMALLDGAILYVDRVINDRQKSLPRNN